MNRSRMIMIGAIALAALLVVVLATRNRQAPPVPNDPNHYSFFDGASCVRCHGKGDAVPQSENHPIGDDCTRCHAMPKP